MIDLDVINYLEMYAEKTAWCAVKKPNDVWTIYKKQNGDELKYKGEIYAPDYVENFEGVIVKYMHELIKHDNGENYPEHKDD